MDKSSIFLIALIIIGISEEPGHSQEQRNMTLIVTPTNSSTWFHENSGQTIGTTMYGPALRKLILLETLTLQNNISSLVAKPEGAKGITLQDICYKPHKKECEVKSILQYYQNSAVNVNKIAWDKYHFFILADYIDHFEFCTRKPTLADDGTPWPLNMSCLATYGRAIQPESVLQGYPGKSYGNATKLVIEYVFDKTVKLELIQRWEARVHQFVKSYHNPNITVAVENIPEISRGKPVANGAVFDDNKEKKKVKQY